ncbi:MAG: M48 family metallopeptidase [Desulfobacteraceae bacterium]
MELPFTLIDYIIVHELAHIKHKHHSKEFDKEVSKFIPDWKNLEEMLGGDGVIIVKKLLSVKNH